jgi:ComF family protein
MTSLPEKIIAIIAPHHCILCSEEDNVLCEACRLTLPDNPYTTCITCGEPAGAMAVCIACQRNHGFAGGWASGEYKDVLAELIKQFKFDGVRAAARPLARLLAQQLPALPTNTSIVPIPTASGRVRQRGYDHAMLLARELGTELGLPTHQLLARRTGLRQVGAKKAQRLAQAAQAFYAPDPAACLGATILLVDDVATTGATLCAAAGCLRRAGAAVVFVAVVAHKT